MAEKRFHPVQYKDQTSEEFIKSINEQYPISLQYNKDLVERVAERYPLLTKTQIAIIVTKTFEGMRDMIFMGKKLAFYHLFFDTKLVIWQPLKTDRVKLRIQTNFPKELHR